LSLEAGKEETGSVVEEVVPSSEEEREAEGLLQPVISRAAARRKSERAFFFFIAYYDNKSRDDFPLQKGDPNGHHPASRGEKEGDLQGIIGFKKAKRTTAGQRNRPKDWERRKGLFPKQVGGVFLFLNKKPPTKN
jgi:hypothetical protein